MTSFRAAPYAVNDLKNATDDALIPYLTSLPKPYTFKQQHQNLNIRLILGYTAVAIAGALFYADWKLGWDATKQYTFPACAVYFLLNGVLTYWIWGVEAGTVFTGVREGGQRLTLKSSGQKHQPFYKLKVRYEPGSQSTVWEDKEIQGTFMEWFDKDGVLQQKYLKSWLSKNVEVIGLADPESKSFGINAIEDERVQGDTIVAASPDHSYDTPKTKKTRKKA